MILCEARGPQLFSVIREYRAQQTSQGATRARSNTGEIRKEDIFTNPVAQGRKVQ